MAHIKGEYKEPTKRYRHSKNPHTVYEGTLHVLKARTWYAVTA
jgi:hypothetical protein